MGLRIGDSVLVDLDANQIESQRLCAVARLGYDQMRKLPESKPGTAILDSSVAAAFIVDAFR